MKKILFIILCIISVIPVVVAAVDSHSADFGTTAYAEASDASTLDLGASEDFTFEIWYRPADQPTGNYLGTPNYDTNDFFTKWQPSYPTYTREYAWSYAYDGTNYEICVTTSDNGTNDAGHLFSNCKDVDIVTTGTWGYFAVTYTDSTGTFEVYQGDEDTCPTSKGTMTPGYGAYAGNSRFRMAQGDNVMGQTADGIIGEARLWRKARTVTELKEGFAPDAVSSGTGLLEIWKFNNAWTAEINGNTLTTFNSPTFTTTIPTVTASCGATSIVGVSDIYGTTLIDVLLNTN